MSPSRRVGAAVGTALLLVGCGPSTNADGIATYDPAGTGGMQALLSATVAVEDGCLYARSPEFGERWLPVFPRESVSWDGQTLDFRGREYVSGEAIDLPGGAISEPTSPRPVDDSYDVPDVCSTEFVWLVTPG